MEKIFDGERIHIDWENPQENYVRHIVKVLWTIPEKERQDICKNCGIILNTTDYGFQSSGTNKDIIFLNWTQMVFDRLHWKQIRHVIAHEFAHYILKHRNLTDGEQKVLGIDQEKEANDLATKWGFPDTIKKIKKLKY